MGSALKLKQASLSRQQGERARLKVVQGPDYGTLYIVTDAKATIGRGEENDIVISDLKASRRHAELAQGAAGWSVKDLGSSNGILVNGKVSRGSDIKTGDSVSVGETVFEFVAADASTSALASPARTPAQQTAQESALAAQKAKVRALGMFGGAPATRGPALSSSGAPGKRGPRPLAMLALAAGAAFLIFGGNEQPRRAPARKGATEGARDLAAYLPTNDAAVSKTADMFFKLGFREYREGNYLRAKTQFETVLQIAPGHQLATLYLQNCNRQITEEVKVLLENGKKDLESGKLKEARGSFEAVLRLLYKDQANPSFAEAKEQLVKVGKAESEEDRG